MKKVFSILAITGLMMFGTVQAQDSTQTTEPAAVEAAVAPAAEATTEDVAAEATDETAERGFTQELKQRFIEGGPEYMGAVLLCLILGLAIAIERIIYLNLSTTNSKKLIK